VDESKPLVRGLEKNGGRLITRSHVQEITVKEDAEAGAYTRPLFSST